MQDMNLSKKEIEQAPCARLTDFVIGWFLQMRGKNHSILSLSLITLPTPIVEAAPPLTFDLMIQTAVAECAIIVFGHYRVDSNAHHLEYPEYGALFQERIGRH